MLVGVAASRTETFRDQNHRLQSKFAYCKLFGVYTGVIFLFAIERYAKMREKALCRCFSFRLWPLTQVNSSQIVVVLNARGGPSLAARWAPGEMCLLYEAPRGDG